MNYLICLFCLILLIFLIFYESSLVKVSIIFTGYWTFIMWIATIYIKDIDYSSVGDKIIKFIIPAKLKRECLYYLRNKNITKEYLFPKTKEDYKLEKICSNILCEFRARESRLF